AGVERYDSAQSTFFLNRDGSGQYRFFSGNANFRIRIADDPGVKNYYVLTPMAVLVDTNGVEYTDGFFTYIYGNGQSDGVVNIYFYTNGLNVTDDVLVNGNEVAVDAGISISSNGSATIPEYKYVKLY